jgi:hypothetical protein
MARETRLGWLLLLVVSSACLVNAYLWAHPVQAGSCTSSGTTALNPAVPLLLLSGLLAMGAGVMLVVTRERGRQPWRFVAAAAGCCVLLVDAVAFLAALVFSSMSCGFF